MKNNREIMVELLQMRGLNEEQARLATDLFYTNYPEGPPNLNFSLEESLNDFLRELIGRALMLPMQMFLARIPEKDRKSLEKKLYPEPERK